MKGPIKILARARDFYVQSLSNCAGHAAFSSAVGCPTPQFASLPRSFSANSLYLNYSSSEKDLRELIRIASTHKLTGKTKAELLQSSYSVGVAAVLRSPTAAIGRIDEDMPYEYGGDSEVYVALRSI